MTWIPEDPPASWDVWGSGDGWSVRSGPTHSGPWVLRPVYGYFPGSGMQNWDRPSAVGRISALCTWRVVSGSEGQRGPSRHWPRHRHQPKEKRPGLLKNQLVEVGASGSEGSGLHAGVRVTCVRVGFGAPPMSQAMRAQSACPQGWGMCWEGRVPRCAPGSNLSSGTCHRGFGKWGGAQGIRPLYSSQKLDSQNESCRGSCDFRAVLQRGVGSCDALSRKPILHVGGQPPPTHRRAWGWAAV